MRYWPACHCCLSASCWWCYNCCSFKRSPPSNNTHFSVSISPVKNAGLPMHVSNHRHCTGKAAEQLDVSLQYTTPAVPSHMHKAYNSTPKPSFLCAPWQDPVWTCQPQPCGMGLYAPGPVYVVVAALHTHTSMAHSRESMSVHSASSHLSQMQKETNTNNSMNGWETQ